MDVVAKQYLEQYGQEMTDPHSAAVSMITNIRRRQWSKEAREKQYSDASGVSRCRPMLDLGGQHPICENYALSAITEQPWSAMARPVSTDTKRNRLMILTLSDCQNLEECTREVLDEFDFVENAEEEYHNYGTFVRAARELIETSISYFESPHIRLLGYLEAQGFAGCHDAYE